MLCVATCTCETETFTQASSKHDHTPHKDQQQAVMSDSEEVNEEERLEGLDVEHLQKLKHLSSASFE